MAEDKEGHFSPSLSFGVFVKFEEVVQIRRATPCPTCQSFIYTLKVPVDPTLAEHLFMFGAPLYPLDKSRIFMIESEAVTISSMIGRTELRVKYKKNAEALKIAMRAQLSSYLTSKLNTEVTA